MPLVWFVKGGKADGEDTRVVKSSEGDGVFTLE